LLKASVGFGAVVVVLGGGARWLVSDRGVAPGRAALSTREADVVKALADAHFPPGNVLGFSADDVDVVAGADAYLAALLPEDRRLFRALLTAFDQWPRLSLASTSTFSALDTNARVSVLRAFEESARIERRLIASLFRTLVGMPFFDDARVLSAIGFTPGCGVFP
jgi:hypothetical protein